MPDGSDSLPSRDRAHLGAQSDRGLDGRSLSSIVKAYDIRGLVPDDLNADVARAIGVAFARVTEAAQVAVGRDMRPSSPEIAAAFVDGAAAHGADVIDIGLASTDMLYFACGALAVAGAMVTASHNPPDYNGIKLCRAGAAPIGAATGLAEIRAEAERVLAGGTSSEVARRGAISTRDVLDAYAKHLRSLVDLSGIRRLRVVVDAANAMAGHTVPVVLHGLPVEVIPLYFELDGTFPNHEANPIDPANLVDLQRTVVDRAADIGLAFDGDADRCWVVDEHGDSVSPSAITALVAVRELAKEPGATVIHNLITSRAVPEIVREHGGVPIRTRVGHSLIKEEMARTGAIFGGEHSAHYYFRDFWRADTGMLAALHVLAALGGQPRPLSELVSNYVRYAASGEINSTVGDQAGRLAAVREAYGERPGVTTDELDGLTVSAADWWFNLRPSNTEPLLRLNVEAVDARTAAAVRDDVLAIVRV